MSEGEQQVSNENEVIYARYHDTGNPWSNRWDTNLEREDSLAVSNFGFYIYSKLFWPLHESKSVDVGNIFDFRTC